MVKFSLMDYAVIVIGGKQYRVSPEEELLVDRLPGKVDETVTFDPVYLRVKDGQVSLGTPQLSQVTVTGKILAHLRGPKIRVAIYKAKSRYRKVRGHRQSLTRVKITSIVDREKGGKRVQHQARR